MARPAARRQTQESPRAAHWRKMIAEWEGSGQTQVAFCRERNESITSFRWWRWQLRKRDQENRPKFLPVRVIENPEAAQGPSRTREHDFEVVLSKNCIIRVPQQFESRALLRLIRVLEEAKC